MEERKNKLLYIVGIGAACLLILCILILAILLHQSRQEEKALKEKSLRKTEILEEEMEEMAESATMQESAAESNSSAESGAKQASVTEFRAAKRDEKVDYAAGTEDLPDLSDHQYQELTDGQSLSLIFINPSGEVKRQGKYLGKLKNGQPHGRGAFASHNAEGIPWLYVGSFEAGKAEGSGIAVWADEYDYSDGKGYCQYFEGNFAGGAFVEGKIHSYSAHGQSSHKGTYPAQTPELPSLPDDFPDDFPRPSFPRNKQAEHFLEF